MHIFQKKIILFQFIFLFLLNGLYSQQHEPEITTTSSRARRAFENAIQHYNAWENKKAEEEFKNAIKYDPQFIEAYIILGEMYYGRGRFEECIDVYRSAIEIDPDFFPNNHFYLAESKLKLGKYEEALQRINIFLSYSEISDNMIEQSNRVIATCEYAIEAIQSPVPFNPMNIGETINTQFAEYSPSLTADEKTMYFTRKQKRERSSIFGESEFEDIFYSIKKDGKWQPAVNIGSPVNTPRNEGFLSISADGLHLFFTACNRPEGVGSCDIYYSRRKGDNWEKPENMGFRVNSRQWDSQPSATADGRVMYFTSARSGSIGTTDIWMTKLQDDSQWANPVNIGPVINTKGREMSPFITPDNKTLYFASDGHIGMGGYDLFYSKRDEEGNWTIPVNLGYPINTYRDEFSLFIGASGKDAYFAADVEKESGQTDIFYFELYEEARPDPITYMKGRVFDIYSRRPVQASFEIIDLEKDVVLISSESDPVNGDFLVAIPVDINIALNVSAKGYLFYSDNLLIDKAYTGIEPYLTDIPLRPIRVGETAILRNIFFDYDKYDLKPQSKIELNRLINLMKQNPEIRIEIGGHTDNVGSYEYNLQLSFNRAKSVYEYLTDNGILADRLEYKGYADKQPIDTNETEEGRANNRRTEFTVLE